MTFFKWTYQAVFIAGLMLCVQDNSMAECPCNKGALAGSVGMELTPVAQIGHQTFHGPSVAPQPMMIQPYQNYGGMLQYRSGGYYTTDHYAMPPQMNTGSMLSMPGGMSNYQIHMPPRRTPSPPPGTIGKTFKLPSRPVPVEKHPRVGMLDVRVVDAHDVIVHDMNAMRTEDTIDGFKDAKEENIWHFESKPLYPGLDHIYRIQATFKNPDGSDRKEERYVRLIMGRVVELIF